MKQFHFIDKNKQQTIVFLQGGPSPFFFLDTNIEKNSIPQMWRPYMELIRNLPELFFEYNIICPLQPQHINDQEINDEIEAKIFIANSLDNIAKSVEFLKKKSHKIIMVGHSFGGYLIHEYIIKYGLEEVDKFIVANSRIKTPKLFYENIIESNKLAFVDTEDNIIGLRQGDKEMTHLNTALAYVQNRDYSIELDSLDLTNVLYLSSIPDKWLGKLSRYELEWAKNKKATILLTPETDITDFKNNFSINIGKETLAHNSLFYKPICDKIKNWL